MYKKDKESLAWQAVPTSSYKLPQQNYPNNCLTLDIADIPDVKGKVVDLIYIPFNHVSFATEVDMEVVDRLKVTNRHYVYSKLSYQGPTISIDNLSEPKMKTYVVSFKQNVYLEEDKNINCVVYPTEKFSSYQDCENHFQADLLKNETLYPAWATPEDVNKATNISKGAGLKYKTMGFAVGTIHTSCKPPCTVTSVRSFYSFTDYRKVNGRGLSSLLVALNPDVEVTRHVFPSYGPFLILNDLGGCSGLWVGISVTQALEVAVMALTNRIRDRLDACVIQIGLRQDLTISLIILFKLIPLVNVFGNYSVFSQMSVF